MIVVVLAAVLGFTADVLGVVGYFVTPTSLPQDVITAPTPTSTKDATSAPTSTSTPAPDPRGPTGLPIRVVSVVLERTAMQGDTYVFPGKFEPSYDELIRLKGRVRYPYEGWFRSHGGVDPTVSVLKVVLEGNRKDAIRITDIRPVKHCTGPLLGTIFDSPPAGAEPSIGIGFDLTKDRPRAQVLKDMRLLKDDYFLANTVTLKPREQQVFQIAAFSGPQYCEYVLELTVIDDGQLVTQTIRNGGKPFRVTGLSLVELKGSLEVSYARYSVAYVGGILLPEGSEVPFERVDPATFRAGR